MLDKILGLIVLAVTNVGRVLKPVSKISGVYGQPGEEKVSQLISEQLSDDFVILNSPRIYYHGATFDIDHIVIGPNGVFVIETKNIQGSISGGIMGNWVQEKTRSGRSKRIKLGNPANQVNQYGKVVKSHLGSRLVYETGKKLNIKIYPIVVFVHKDINFSKMDFTKPGYVGHIKVSRIGELIDFIKRHEIVLYTKEDVDLFAQLLVPENQREQTTYFSLDKLQDYTGGNVNRYEIFEELGRGSFGIVFKGFDYKLDKEIAVKKLPLQNQNDSNVVNRFFREAQITSSLSHDNIISVYDYYEKSGEYYIVMEMVEGPTLEQYIRENQISVSEALGIFKDIASALAYAHEKQVIHRDLKPSNILIDSNGMIKVTDFGIAKLVNASNLTMDNTSAGTPIIMSPEQIKGKGVTYKSDIFALGVVLYFLLTGKMPFDGEHVGEIVHKITHLEPIEPSKLNNEISADLEFIILKALAKRPEDRFEDVNKLSLAIDELIATGRFNERTFFTKLSRYIPKSLRPFVGTERKLYTVITVLSLAVFLGLLGFQSYRDSRQLSRGLIQTNQFGFTNENISQLFENPIFFTGLPVNLVGRIEKVIAIDQNSTQFSLVIHVEGETKDRSVIVKISQPHFEIPFTRNIEVTGSVQGQLQKLGEKIPVVIADKISPMEDPWSVLAPSLYTIYPNKIIKRNKKVIKLEKIEFSEHETRLYVRLLNDGTSYETFVLNKPVAKQGIRQFKGLPNNYEISDEQIFQLQPQQEFADIIFLEPLDRKITSAVITLGSGNNELNGQQPYVFSVNW